MRARISASVQTGRRAHSVFYTRGTGSFLGVKRPGRGADHPPPSSAEVKERVELYLCSPLWAFVACSGVNFRAHVWTLQLTYGLWKIGEEEGAVASMLDGVIFIDDDC
jgi:hypothetical protein